MHKAVRCLHAGHMQGVSCRQAKGAVHVNEWNRMSVWLLAMELRPSMLLSDIPEKPQGYCVRLRWDGMRHARAATIL